MDTALDESTKEALLRDIIVEGSDALSSMFLNDNDGLEGEGEEAAGPLLIDLHGSDEPMPVQEGEGEEVDREDGSGDHQTESGQVYILVKPVLTS